MAIQVTLSANQFNHSGTYNNHQYTSIQVESISNGRIYFSTIQNGMRMSRMAKQMKLVDGNVIISFGKNNKLIVGTYSDDTIQEVIEEPATIDNTIIDQSNVQSLFSNVTPCKYTPNPIDYIIHGNCAFQLSEGNDKHSMIPNKKIYSVIAINMLTGEIDDTKCTDYDEGICQVIYLSKEAALKEINSYSIQEPTEPKQSPINLTKQPIPAITKPVNKLTNKDLASILTKFAAMSETRPALNYGYYNGQTMYATDSQKIISIDKSLIKYLNNESTTHLYDIIKGEKSDDQVKYPNVERFFDTHSNEEFTINKKDITQLSKLIKTIKATLNERYLYNIKLQFETVHNELLIMGYTQNGDYKETEYFNTGITANNISFILNASFLSDTLNTHKKLMKLTGDKELTLSYTSHLRPIKFSLQSGLATILLMPIRKY